MPMGSERILGEISRLPSPGDNVAIAVRRLAAGDVVPLVDGQEIALSHTIPEGHRFAVRDIAVGDPLLSWGLPFGIASSGIAAGDYVCNQSVLDSLAGRSVDFVLPDAPNFEDRIRAHALDARTFRPGSQVAPREDPPTFQGYDRGGRGVGTRNTIIVLATSSNTSGYAQLLAERLKNHAAKYDQIDDIVAVVHTEGGAREIPNNKDLLLKTLAGFMTHPNVAAVLAVDYGTEATNNRNLREFMGGEGYPLNEVLHHFLSLGGDLVSQLDAGERVIGDWLEPVNAMRRSAQPLSELKIALQCGGSDAFSGISGNPLAAWSARELIRCGGSAVLAETDELIGAESYVLQNVRDLETAQQFLHMIARFQERVAWHGASAEGNPSGGNKFGGLYNIVLKSIGAAAKMHPELRLDRVIDYAQPLTESGFYFMDSPGNDLESIAGEVASGCNLIYFVTGNGSITNFPFVPTIKIVTTTRRYELLSADMDVNAGAYLDGVSMESLGQALFEKSLDVVSGERSRGELAGHSQVQIWRNWKQTDDARLTDLLDAELPDGSPLSIRESDDAPDVTFKAFCSDNGNTSGRVGLILPTSLCSGQVARMGAQRLNEKGQGDACAVSRYAALVHTEGCGVTVQDSEDIHTRLMLSYLQHPMVDRALLLEHGCEKTHNDFVRNALAEKGQDLDRFGWASVQLDGGIDKVLDRVESWFAHQLSDPPRIEDAGLGSLRVGLLSSGSLSSGMAAAFARIMRWIVSAGGSVVVHAEDDLVASSEFISDLLPGREPRATLAFGQVIEQPGFHVMATPTRDPTELITGLGATGVEIILASVGDHPVQGHPFIPVLQVSGDGDGRYRDDMDLVLAGNLEDGAGPILDLIVRTASREYTARSQALGNIAYQVTRGLLGVST
jgi:altronate dehydratase